jgi:metal-responsive CopG/Arc/MetJ family transcriptional regulator
MANPRITFRIPEDLYRQLPTDDRERSALIRRLLEDYLNPRNPESELANLKARVERLERQNQFLIR